MLMVRFFCGEMGLHLRKGGQDLEDSKTLSRSPFRVQRFTEAEAKSDVRYRSLLAVMMAANRAVAHIDNLDVDHPINTEMDHYMLFDSITWIEGLIQSNMYAPNGRSLRDAMALQNNVM